MRHLRHLLFAFTLLLATAFPATALAAPTLRCLPAQCTATQVTITTNGQTWICWSDFSLCWQPGWNSWMKYGRWNYYVGIPAPCTAQRPCHA